jgi:MoaA/NifB/PqqE/SkfB family radical SAM enzyme
MECHWMSKASGYYDWGKMTITLTNKCDLTCKMCGIIRGEKHSLTRDQAMHCADFALRMGFQEIELTGGEPTLVKYFWELLDELCQNTDAMIKVTTNAVRLDEERVERLASYPNLYVQVSIDGLEETHDRIRGQKDAFSRSSHNIRRFSELGVKNLSINSVVQRSNFRDMVELYEYFKDVPLIFHAFSLIEDREFCPDEEIPVEECQELIEVLGEIQRRGQEDNRDVILTDDLLRLFKFRITYPQYISHPGKGCTVVKKGLIITHEGHALPCWHTPWDVSRNDRSIHHHTLDEIVNSPVILAELEHARNLGGCVGCSTMCYNWDSEFREKVMRPKGATKIRQAMSLQKEKLRYNHPAVFGAAKTVRAKFRG